MPMFARRHYQFLAEFLGERLAMAEPGPNYDNAQATVQAMIADLTGRLHRDNPGFKPGRFRAAVDKAAGTPPHRDAGRR